MSGYVAIRPSDTYGRPTFHYYTHMLGNIHETVMVTDLMLLNLTHVHVVR